MGYAEFCFAHCHFAEYTYAEHHLADCHYRDSYYSECRHSEYHGAHDRGPVVSEIILIMYFKNKKKIF
jgi:hypothetical protein